jgi:hypothetical protein
MGVAEKDTRRRGQPTASYHDHYARKNKMLIFNVYKYFCKECGWMGDKLEKSGCVTYADEWYVCPKCKRDASIVIAHNKSLDSDPKKRGQVS